MKRTQSTSTQFGLSLSTIQVTLFPGLFGSLIAAVWSTGGVSVILQLIGHSRDFGHIVPHDFG